MSNIKIIYLSILATPIIYVILLLLIWNQDSSLIIGDYITDLIVLVIGGFITFVLVGSVIIKRFKGEITTEMISKDIIVFAVYSTPSLAALFYCLLKII